MTVIGTTEPTYPIDTVRLQVSVYDVERRAAEAAGFEFLTSIVSQLQFVTSRYVVLSVHGWEMTGRRPGEGLNDELLIGTVTFRGVRRPGVAALRSDP